MEHPEGVGVGPVFSVARTVSGIEQVTSKHLLTKSMNKGIKIGVRSFIQLALGPCVYNDQ